MLRAGAHLRCAWAGHVLAAARRALAQRGDVAGPSRSCSGPEQVVQRIGTMMPRATNAMRWPAQAR